MSETNELDLNYLYVLIKDIIHKMASHYHFKKDRINRRVSSLMCKFNKRQWQNTENFVGVNYNNPLMCCAYLQRYAYCHAALTRYATVEILRNNPHKIVNYLINRERLNITSAGGGPGNDLVGFCSAIEEVLNPKLSKSFSHLCLNVVDLKNGWKDIFYMLLNTYKQQSKIQELSENLLQYEFIQADLCNEKVKTIENADVILLVKVLSNVSKHQKISILKNLFSSIKEKAIILYIDTGIQFVEKIAFKLNMTVLYIRNPREFQISFNGTVPENLLLKSTFGILVLQNNIKKEYTNLNNTDNIAFDYNRKDYRDEQKNYKDIYKNEKNLKLEYKDEFKYEDKCDYENEYEDEDEFKNQYEFDDEDEFEYEDEYEDKDAFKDQYEFNDEDKYQDEGKIGNEHAVEDENIYEYFSNNRVFVFSLVLVFVLGFVLGRQTRVPR